jgi:hypothetical protein
LNGQMTKMNAQLLGAGFTPALRDGTATHRNGNFLDQMWTRNIAITNAIVAHPIDQVSDHQLIQVRMEATLVNRQQPPHQVAEGVDPRSLPQTTIRKVVKECLENGLFDTTPYIDKRPLIDYIPQEVVASHRPVA